MVIRDQLMTTSLRLNDRYWGIRVAVDTIPHSYLVQITKTCSLLSALRNFIQFRGIHIRILCFSPPHSPGNERTQVFCMENS